MDGDLQGPGLLRRLPEPYRGRPTPTAAPEQYRAEPPRGPACQGRLDAVGRVQLPGIKKRAFEKVISSDERGESLTRLDDESKKASAPFQPGRNPCPLVRFTSGMRARGKGIPHVRYRLTSITATFQRPLPFLQPFGRRGLL
ncbi:hypothetical protein SKAU_G00237190 [Synaphobranchus kaupii]|uniref:Uncharacterized protein n=1 Tax=Synaphobranchus kaupii TaxID=118154 RepID=A0A9Q1F6X4_SYNKA|nr:hypothetical protein SKAU_G00237190 [Synaphobranchus kaupii]